MKKENIKPKDENGQLHGYCEQYYANSELKYKGNYIHNCEDGYWGFYNYYGILNKKVYYIK